jgi:hypothetical protein
MCQSVRGRCSAVVLVFPIVDLTFRGADFSLNAISADGRVNPTQPASDGLPGADFPQNFAVMLP